jgi:hypothetical protein
MAHIARVDRTIQRFLFGWLSQSRVCIIALGTHVVVTQPEAPNSLKTFYSLRAFSYIRINLQVHATWFMEQTPPSRQELWLHVTLVLYADFVLLLVDRRRAITSKPPVRSRSIDMRAKCIQVYDLVARS